MRKLLPYFIAFLFFTISTKGFCQDSESDIDPILIRLKARIISAGDSMAVPYANIVNKHNRSSTSSNTGGFFSIEMLNIDSLFVSAMGFKSIVVKIPRNYSEAGTLIIYLQPMVYFLNEVKVSGNKSGVNMTGVPVGKESTIPVELRGDAFNEKPPIIAAFFNPISYWQYYLGKREKEKREIREAIALEKNWEMHSKNYNKEMVKMLTGLNENDADTFMVWFNSRKVLPYTSTEYEVRAAIKNWFEVYKNLKKPLIY